MQQTLLLARTFFRRFFESELMPPGLPQVQLTISALTLLAAPGLLLPVRFAANYIQLERYPPALAHALLAHRLLFVTFTMIGLGLVALVIWEGVFPDRRDARILGALPVRGSTLIAARLGALGALAALFVVGMNAIPTILYGPVLAEYGAAATPVHGALAHFVATSCAGAFVFFGLIALQGLLLNLAGRRLAERLSVALQLVFVVGLLQMIFFFPRLGQLFGTELGDLTTHPAIRLLPSVWFLALYDFVGGRPSPDAHALAAVALLATATVTLAAIGLLVATHGRLAKLALESRHSVGGRGRVLASLSRYVNATIVRNSTERATLQFTLKTMIRSRTHRMLIALYLGVALALVVSAFLPLLVRLGFAGLTVFSIPLLSAPLVVMFLGLAGMRAVFAIPVEPKAHWVIRLLEPPRRMAAINGVWDAMMLALVIPVCSVVLLTTAILLGVWPAIVHTTVCLLLGWILAELLVITLSKLPFTCTYYPGLSRMRTMWPAYLIAFMNYCYSTPSLEYAIVGHPPSLAVFVAVCATVILAIRIARARRLAALPGFKFEEEDPEAMFRGFNLSEGLAAAPKQ
jgi:hypothetical protein